MSGSSEPVTRTTRAGMLRQAARILSASFLGWAAGAVAIWWFGSGSLHADVGLLVAGAVLWAAIPLSFLRMLRHRAGSPRTERPRTWGIWFLIAAFTGSAVIGIVRPATESWTSLQIWSAIHRIVIGGHHTMVADVTLVDARTGAIVLPYAAQSSMAMAGQGIAGALVDAAVMAEPIERVVNNYADQYGDWLLRR